LFHKSVFHNVRFNEEYVIFEDWDILLNLSKNYWFKHIDRVTTKYNQWCNISQISRRAAFENFSEAIYKKILSQNMSIITPEAIYTACVYNASERMKLISELISQKNGYSANSPHFENLTFQRDQLALLEFEKKGIELENMQLRQAYNNIMSELSNSLSWRLITKYRKIKEKAIPKGTRMRTLYDALLDHIVRKKIIIN
jgi:hypothetical protein